MARPLSGGALNIAGLFLPKRRMPVMALRHLSALRCAASRKRPRHGRVEGTVDFVLIGSRARGTARPDSDWDFMADMPPIDCSGMSWPMASWHVVRTLGGFEGVKRLYDEARRQFGVPDGDEVDIFVPIRWGRTWAALLEWDEGHDCLGGWFAD